MKNLFITLFLSVTFMNVTYSQNVGIGTSTPNSTSILELSATDRGFLPPRLTTAQRDAILSPAEGLVIYNITIQCLEYYNGTSWQSICGAPPCTPPTAPTAGNSGTVCAGGDLTLTASNIAGATYAWSGPSGYTSALQNPVITAIAVGQAGVYSVIATVAGCPSASSSTTVTVTVGPVASVICLGAPCDLPCSGGTVSLRANPIGMTYSWSGPGGFTAATRDVTISIAGTYTLSVSNGGCASTATYTVNTSIIPFVTAIVQVIGVGGRIWMDRNLGASQAATSSTDVNAYGDLYQWGRLADGHQCRSSPTSVTLSSADQPGNGNFIITGLNVPYDWRSPQNTNLWQGVAGVNNPCPNTYRIPTEAELNAERAAWSSQNAAGAFASSLKLTLAGGRSENVGAFAGVGTTGFYWSSTVNSPNSRNLNFNGGAALINSNVRAYGHSVRCIRN